MLWQSLKSAVRPECSRHMQYPLWGLCNVSNMSLHKILDLWDHKLLGLLTKEISLNRVKTTLHDSFHCISIFHIRHVLETRNHRNEQT